MADERRLPFDKYAEMAVLGMIYFDPECYSEVSRRLAPSDFYFTCNQELFAVFGMCLAESNLDLVMINAKLEQRGTLSMAGGIPYLVELANFVPDGGKLDDFVGLVREYAERRRLIDRCDTAIGKLLDKGEQLRETKDFLMGGLMAEQASDSTVKNISESVGEFLRELERRQNAGEKMAGISTGYDELDMVLGGLEPGKLYVLGGRPSMGKTALALNIAAKIAEHGETVMYFSLEMKNYEVTKRIASAISRVGAKRIKTAAVTDDEYIKIADAAGKFMPESLYIDDNGYQTMQSITSSCITANARLARSGRKIGCVMIDHLHLLSSANKGLDRRLQIGEASRLAKLLADKMDCPVVLLSQLSRASTGRSDPRPLLSDLRESGDIEQDADVVMFVHREEYYRPKDDNHGKAEIIFAKNRDGECGTVIMGWNSYITSFLPWEEYSASESHKTLPPLRNRGETE